MMESFPGFMFHMPIAIRNTAITMVMEVKPMRAKGIWKSEL